MMGERLGIDRRTALAVLRVMARHGEDPASARIAARALASGQGVDSAPVESLLSALVGDEAWPRPEERRGASDAASVRDETEPRRAPNGDGQGGSASDRRDRRDSSGCEEPGLKERLKGLAQRALNDPALVSLARPAPEGDGWICLPFDLRLDGMPFHGIFRICYYKDSRPARFIADIRTNGERRLLELRGSGAGLCLRYGADDEGERSAFAERFSGLGRVSGSSVAEAYTEELARGRGVDQDA